MDADGIKVAVGESFGLACEKPLGGLAPVEENGLAVDQDVGSTPKGQADVVKGLFARRAYG